MASCLNWKLVKKQFKLLDLYCGGGGATEGYQRAGWYVTGVDNNSINKKNYCGDEFICDDAIQYCLDHGHEYDAIHASPPCQAYSVSTALARQRGKTYPNLIETTRAALLSSGKPFIIENVPPAPIRKDIKLRGDMFGLKVLKIRVFEIEGWFMFNSEMPMKIGTVRAGDFCSVFGDSRMKFKKNGSGNAIVNQPFKHNKGTISETWSFAMDIRHKMTVKQIAESIPPAYTHYIGAELMRQLMLKR